MEKEFEALKRIETVFPLNKEGKPNVYKEYSNSVEPFYNDFDLVLNALLELQAIKEAEPSEALETNVVLKFIDGLLKRYEDITDYNIYITKEWLLEVKQALLKAEKLEKAWDIVKEKNVDVFHFKLDLKRMNKDFSYRWYKANYGNYHCGMKLQLLTEEEFELIKECFE